MVYEGQINTPVVPTSRLGYVLCSSAGSDYPMRKCKRKKKKLLQHDIANYISKRLELAFWQAFYQRQLCCCWCLRFLRAFSVSDC